MKFQIIIKTNIRFRIIISIVLLTVLLVILNLFVINIPDNFFGVWILLGICLIAVLSYFIDDYKYIGDIIFFSDKLKINNGTEVHEYNLSDIEVIINYKGYKGEIYKPTYITPILAHRDGINSIRITKDGLNLLYNFIVPSQGDTLKLFNFEKNANKIKFNIIDQSDEKI